MNKLNKKVLGVIPARIGSTRIPEKMLADIAGKPLIQHTIERTLKAELLDHLIVWTDSKDIAHIAESLGVQVHLTSSELSTGTDQVIETAKQFKGFNPEIVVNIWGDEPMYPASAIDDCIKELQKDKTLAVSLAGDKITDESMLREPSIVQVLTDINNNVLFFSRAPIPYQYTDYHYDDHYHVIGVMAMRRDFVDSFAGLHRTPIEMAEGVEQLRILEHGYRMRLVKGEYNNLGVNTPEELEIVRQIYSSKRKDTQ